MGFLKNFFTNVFHEEAGRAQVQSTNGFAQLSKDELETHLAVARYGDFTLTDAVRPSYNLQVIPKQGYRHEEYKDEDSNASVPVLMAAASRENLFELFMELIEPLGNVVDVVLETSHGTGGKGHSDLYREHIDMPVLKSVLWDFEDLLTNDGCTGIAVLNPNVPHEIQFDEHKLLIVYSNELDQFERVFQSRGIRCDEKLAFITEAEHVHSSSESFQGLFNELKTELGMDATYA